MAWSDETAEWRPVVKAGFDRTRFAVYVRRGFRLITKKAGIGETWSPREPRHSFVSIMSDGGVPVEAIADLCGHSSPAVTGEVYRHQLKPVITRGAEVADVVFGPGESV